MGVRFDDFIRDNRAILFPFISTRLQSLGMIDLTLLPEEVIDYLFNWILKVNRQRIENQQEIIVNYDIIKMCPIWQVVEMPYRSMKLLGMSKPVLKPVTERQKMLPQKRSPIRPIAPIKPRKPL